MKYRKDGIRDSQGHLPQRRGKLIVWNVGCRERMKTPPAGGTGSSRFRRKARGARERGSVTPCSVRGGA